MPVGCLWGVCRVCGVSVGCVRLTFYFTMIRATHRLHVNSLRVVFTNIYSYKEMLIINRLFRFLFVVSWGAKAFIISSIFTKHHVSNRNSRVYSTCKC